MPELPEVETMCRGIAPVVGSEILDVHFVKSQYKKIHVTPRRDRFAQRVVGQSIHLIGRRGKRILLHLKPAIPRTGPQDRVIGHTGTIVIEPRMTGLMLLADPPNEAHLRIGFHLRHDRHPWLWFWDRRGLGTVRFLSPAEFDRALGPDQLGPDALDVTMEDLRSLLGSRRRAVKVALLDQHFVAGIGNLYASELLHAARVHPERHCFEVTPAEWVRIHQSMLDVLHDAILHEGSTLSDGTYRTALNQQGTYQNRHQVYGRSDQPCLRCRTGTIRRIVQAQRATFFCPQCQT